jgi:hypothetical protein
MKRDADKCIPAYVAQILASVSAKPGQIVHVEVLHEPHCNLLRSSGSCNCEPEVKQIRPS